MRAFEVKYDISVFLLLTFFILQFISQCFLFGVEDDQRFFEVSLEELAKMKVNIASKSAESFFNAPAIITVINKSEIESLNPRNMTDILATVPGFNNQTRNLGENMFQVRGIHSVNDTILLMLDGHPLNDRTFGTMIYIINSIPIEAIERIEIIRGPGSTIYGANAFYGVVNIITARGESNAETKIGAKFGSEKTMQGIISYKREDKEKESHLIVTGSLFHTAGPGLDFTDRSGVFGKTSFEQGRTHLYLNYKKGAFGFMALYNKEELGPFVGIAYRLNERTKRKYTIGAIEGKLNLSIARNIEMSGKVYCDTFIYDCFWEFLPKELLPPNGMLMKGYAKDFRLGSEWNAHIRFSDKHRLLMGFVYDYIGLNDAWSSENNETPYQFTLNAEPWISNGRETNFAFYLQDNYFITKKLQLVLGIRYDNHTAYGDSWNPRGGLTMNLGSKSNLKLLFGQAFRAPTFWDIYSNSPDQVKNPGLRPEQIRTIDVELSSSFSDNFFARINFFHNEMTDLILSTPVTIDGQDTSIKKNLGKIKVDGVEMEIRGNFWGSKHYFALNGFYNKSRDIFQDTDVPWVPHFGLGLVLHNKWSEFIGTNIQLKHTGTIEREVSDTRSALSPVTLVNLSFRLSYSGVTLRGSIYNLLDTGNCSPAPFSKKIDDYPHPGRTFLLSLEYRIGD